MKVGDLVVRKMGGSILKDIKGMILNIRTVSGSPYPYYKIKWFNIDFISDKWTDAEFVPYNRSTKEEQ